MTGRMYLWLGVRKNVAPAEDFELGGSPIDEATPLLVERVVFPASCAGHVANLRIRIRRADGQESDLRVNPEAWPSTEVVSYYLEQRVSVEPGDWLIVSGFNPGSEARDIVAGAFGYIVPARRAKRARS